MTYEITWKTGAARDMAVLPLGVASAVVEFVYGALAENPHRVGKPLRFELEGKHSARRGNYRVIYEIFEARVEVQIVVVRHRADAYR
jgi:mRNA interferase RelE/StbE